MASVASPAFSQCTLSIWKQLPLAEKILLVSYTLVLKLKVTKSHSLAKFLRSKIDGYNVYLIFKCVNKLSHKYFEFDISVRHDHGQRLIW